MIRLLLRIFGIIGISGSACLQFHEGDYWAVIIPLIVGIVCYSFGSLKQQIEDTHSSQDSVSKSQLIAPANSRKGHYRGQFWREDTSKEKKK